MKVTKHIPLPTIRLVPRTELQQLWLKANRKHYNSIEYKTERETMIKEVLEQIEGMFKAGSDTIIVSTHMNKKKTESVLVHEMVHYIQEKIDGIVNLYEWNAEFTMIRREMQAYEIDDKYEKQN
jgi:hypothetical protein